MLARLGLDQALYPLLELFDLFLVLLDRRGEPARLVAEFFRRSLVLRFVFAERCEFPVAALIHFVELAFLVLQVGDFASERCGRRVDPGGFLFAHAVVAAHVGDTSRGVVEILRSEQKDEKIVQFVVLVGSINHIRVLFPQLGQFVLHRVNGVVFGADIAVDHLGLFFEVRDDLLTVANTVLDQFELVLGYLLIFFCFGQQFVCGANLLFGPADFVTQRIEALVLRREVQCAKERCEN